MRIRTKVAIAVTLLAVAVTPIAVLVPDYGEAPRGYTGIFWIGTYSPGDINEELWNIGRGAHWERLDPIPGADPPIEAKWQPSAGTLMEKIGQPNSMVFMCSTHGGPDGLGTPTGGLYTLDIKAAMEHREPYRLVILSACSSADGGLVDAFSKGGNETVVLACTGSSFPSTTNPRIEDFITLVSVSANQNRTLYDLYEQAKGPIPPNSHTRWDDPWFYGPKDMTPGDIFAALLVNL